MPNQIKVKIMKNIREYFKEEMPDFDLELAKKIIGIYTRFYRENAFKYCNICGKALTPERIEVVEKDTSCFHITCEEHEKYKSWYVKHNIEKDCGIICPNPFDM